MLESAARFAKSLKRYSVLSSQHLLYDLKHSAGQSPPPDLTYPQEELPYVGGRFRTSHHLLVYRLRLSSRSWMRTS